MEEWEEDEDESDMTDQEERRIVRTAIVCMALSTYLGGDCTGSLATEVEDAEAKQIRKLLRLLKGGK